MTSTLLAKPMIPAAAQTSAFTAAGGRIYPINATSADIVATLPVGARQGATITLIRADGSNHAVTVQCGGSDSINSGLTTVTSLALTGQGQSVTLVSTGGGNWVIAQLTSAGGGSTALTPTAVKTANYTAAVGDLVPVDTTSGAKTVTLPTGPADKAQVAVKHIIQGGTNAVTIAAGGSDVFNKAGGSTSLTLSLVNQAMVLQYKAAGGIWYVVDDSLSLATLQSSFDAVRQISVSNTTGDVAAITAAITAGTTAGKVDGKWATQQGKVARISTPTTIALGYSNTQAANWATDTTTEKVKLSLDILPDAGLGAALTIKGGYGVDLDINVLGGGARGTVTDAATTMRATSADGTISLASPNTVSSATAAFTTNDVGVPITIPGAGVSGVTLYSTITGYTDSTHVTIADTASTAVTTATLQIGSFSVSSPNAIAAGLKPGAVVFITGAGPAPEGVAQPLAASVRTVNSGAGTFTVSEGSWAAVTGASMNWFDVAVRLEDMVGCTLNIHAKGYQGYAFAADATDDQTKRLRSCTFEKINGQSNGGTIFWKSIEAFGSMGSILSNTLYGDYIGMSADMRWDHYEGGVPQPSSQLARAYIWFDRVTALNDLSISVGDRGIEAGVLATGAPGYTPDMGRYSQIRATNYMSTASGTVTSGSNQITNVVNGNLTVKLGQTIVAPGIPDGATVTAVSANGPGGTGNGWTSGSPGTITFSGSAATATASALTVYGLTCDGLKLVGIGSITVGKLDTARCVAGLRVIGGGGNGIRILNHKSLTSDLSPLVVQPGSTGLTPRVEINTDYRFHLGYSIDIKSGLSAGTDVRVSGYTENMHVAYGATGRYAARCASISARLDVAGMRQLTRSGLSGFIDPATVTLVNKHRARLENEVPSANQVALTDGAGSFSLSPYSAAGPLVVQTAQVVVSNTTTATTIAGTYTIPANSVAAGTTYRVRASGTVDNDAGATVTLRLRLGGPTGTSVAQPEVISNASAKTGQGWELDYLVTFRAAASASTPCVVGGHAYNATGGGTQPQGAAATNVNMTVNRDLQVDATWSVASATCVIRCESLTIEQVK